MTRQIKRITAISLVLLLAVTIGVWRNAKAFLPGDGFSAPNDTFDDELQPNEAMSNSDQDCDWTDTGVAVLNYTTSGGANWSGERRTFWNTRSGSGTTVDIEALTTSSFPLKTKRTRWGDTVYAGLQSKLRYYYDVYGRDAVGNFIYPIRFTQNGCTDYSLVATQICGYESCPYGYTYYNETCGCAYPESPIILNLSGGQKFDISTAENGIPFDLNLDNRLEKIASPLEANVVGFLYLDNNLDHNGRNLFGNRNPQPKVEGQEANGFLALRQWDDKKVSKDSSGNFFISGPPDGNITATDGVWKLLRVWFDFNRNGLKDEDELKTLDELGIVALETNYQVVNRKDNNGNAIKMLAKFWKQNDPKPYFMVDYWAATINPTQ